MRGGAALLVIDVQLGMFQESHPVFEAERLLQRIGGLLSSARDAGVPVIHVQHCGGKGHLLEPETSGWPIHPAVAPLETERIVLKRYPDAFRETELAHALNEQQVARLIVCGIQTEYCVDTTCRRASSLGYAVTLIEDAHSTWDTTTLRAQQIIDHHNSTLNEWFVDLCRAEDIDKLLRSRKTQEDAP